MVGGGWYLICFIIKNNLSIMIHLITSSMSWQDTGSTQSFPTINPQKNILRALKQFPLSQF